MKKDNKKFQDQILPLRNEIDAIDAKILSLLARRQAQVEKVVALKKAHSIPVYHPAREEDLISTLRFQSQHHGLDPDFMEDLYRVILRQSRVKQTQKMEEQQMQQALASKEIYQNELTKNGMDQIVTQILPASGVTYWLAEDYHQRYLEKNPNGYDCHSSTGVAYPLLTSSTNE